SDASPRFTVACVASPAAEIGLGPVWLHARNVELVFRGFGVPTEKSVELLSLSVHAFVRSAAVVFASVAVGAVSEQFAAVPKPTRSTTFVVGHVPLSAVVALTSAILPAVALIAILPDASGVGSGVVPPAPCDSCTSRYCPGCSVTFGRFVTCHVLPVELAYCTLYPATLVAVGVGLKTSMKSFVYVAPELPPP